MLCKLNDFDMIYKKTVRNADCWLSGIIERLLITTIPCSTLHDYLQSDFQMHLDCVFTQSDLCTIPLVPNLLCLANNFIPWLRFFQITNAVDCDKHLGDS